MGKDPGFFLDKLYRVGALLPSREDLPYFWFSCNTLQSAFLNNNNNNKILKVRHPAPDGSLNRVDLGESVHFTPEWQSRRLIQDVISLMAPSLMYKK